MSSKSLETWIPVEGRYRNNLVQIENEQKYEILFNDSSASPVQGVNNFPHLTSAIQFVEGMEFAENLRIESLNYGSSQMQLLESIAGLTGEDLTSAILKLLFVRSDELRSKLLDFQLLRSKFSPSHFPSFRNGLICQTEFHTRSEEFGDGRIDLLIHADNCLIAFENKLWAEVQSNQPVKYVDTLRSIAKRKFDRSDAFIVIMLFPKDRYSEIESKIEEQSIKQNCVLLPWETMVEWLSVLRGIESGEIGFIAKSLVDYVKSHLSKQMVGIEKRLLVGDGIHLGNSFHWDYLYKVRELFPNASKMSPGKKHIGFYFRFDENKPDFWHWLGFKVKEGCDEIYLAFESHVNNIHEIGSENFVVESSSDNSSELRLEFSESIDSITEWREFLSPLWDYFEGRDNALRENNSD